MNYKLKIIASSNPSISGMSSSWHSFPVSQFFAKIILANSHNSLCPHFLIKPQVHQICDQISKLLEETVLPNALAPSWILGLVAAGVRQLLFSGPNFDPDPLLARFYSHTNPFS